MTDRELLDAFIQTGRECATAREAAFSELVRRYWRMVYATAHRILDDWQLTEDVAQSVFLLLARKAPTLTTRSILSGWLYTAAGHAARNALRKRQRMLKRESEMIDQHAGSAESQHEAFNWEEIKPHVDRALAALPLTQRDAVVLRLVLQRTPQEAARELLCSEDALSMRLSRGIESLRQTLKRRGVDISSGAVSAALMAHGIPSSVPAALPTVAAAKLASYGSASAGAGTGAAAGIASTPMWLSAGVSAAVVTGVLITGHLYVRSLMTGVLYTEFKESWKGPRQR